MVPIHAGVRHAKKQLKQAFQLIAWMHVELGKPLPEFVGSIVVPLPELKIAQHLLRGSRAVVQAEVPGGHGTVKVNFVADSV